MTERRKVCYPPLRFVKLIIGRSYVTGESQSQIIESGIRMLFESLPDAHLDRYIKAYEQLSEADRKRPNQV